MNLVEEDFDFLLTLQLCVVYHLLVGNVRFRNCVIVDDFPADLHYVACLCPVRELLFHLFLSVIAIFEDLSQEGCSLSWSGLLAGHLSCVK